MTRIEGGKVGSASSQFDAAWRKAERRIDLVMFRPDDWRDGVRQVWDSGLGAYESAGMIEQVAWKVKQGSMPPEAAFGWTLRRLARIAEDRTAGTLHEPVSFHREANRQRA
jgi:hypothetical protein